MGATGSSPARSSSKVMREGVGGLKGGLCHVSEGPAMSIEAFHRTVGCTRSVCRMHATCVRSQRGSNHRRFRCLVDDSPIRDEVIFFVFFSFFFLGEGRRDLSCAQRPPSSLRDSTALLLNSASWIAGGGRWR